ncbi:uncharacterized protein LOC118502346 [Phyllostomus discolor]|uniref:Uncharacterized protein LOC118502346 n=1 Tax=Phyllostomus discolor TaxID=89673 RepID=A0A7E6EG85_9CHIR|nr:uncharacterized protein LOC118502346 [Phyllostomus discolor]
MSTQKLEDLSSPNRTDRQDEYTNSGFTRQLPALGENDPVKLQNSEKRALRERGRGRTPDPLFRTPTLRPPPHPVQVRALRGQSSGAWEARTLPTPSRDPEGSVQGGLTPPCGVPGARETSRQLAARVCTAPSTAWAKGTAAPSGGERDRGGEEAVNSPSVRASPRRALRLRPRRGPPGPLAGPGAAPPGAQENGGESGSLLGGLGHLAERSQLQRRGKSGLTCHYFLRHLGSTCQRPHKALWIFGARLQTPTTHFLLRDTGGRFRARQPCRPAGALTPAFVGRKVLEPSGSRIWRHGVPESTSV